MTLCYESFKKYSIFIKAPVMLYGPDYSMIKPRKNSEEIRCNT